MRNDFYIGIPLCRKMLTFCLFAFHVVSDQKREVFFIFLRIFTKIYLSVLNFFTGTLAVKENPTNRKWFPKQTFPESQEYQ